MSESEHKRRYMTPSEYMNAQKERGGCTEDFKETMRFVFCFIYSTL